MSVMCRLYGVSRAGYYAWRGRGESVRAKADEQLWERIERIYQASRRTLGSPRIHRALKAEGHRVGKKRLFIYIWIFGKDRRPNRYDGKLLQQPRRR